MAFIESSPSDPYRAPAVKREHPDKVSKLCARCRSEHPEDAAVYKCDPPLCGHVDLCENCHAFIRSLLSEMLRCAKRLPEPLLAAIITQLNEKGRAGG